MKILYQAVYYTQSPEEPSFLFSSPDLGLVQKFILEERGAKFFDPSVNAWFFCANHDPETADRYCILRDFLVETEDDFNLRRAVIRYLQLGNKAAALDGQWHEPAKRFCIENKM